MFSVSRDRRDSDSPGVQINADIRGPGERTERLPDKRIPAETLMKLRLSEKLFEEILYDFANELAEQKGWKDDAPRAGSKR